MTATFKQSQIFGFVLAALAAVLLSVLIAPQQAQASELPDNPEVLAESASEVESAAAAACRQTYAVIGATRAGWSGWIGTQERGCGAMFIRFGASEPATCKAYFVAYRWNGSSWVTQVFRELTPGATTRVYSLSPGAYAIAAAWTNGECGIRDLAILS